MKEEDFLVTQEQFMRLVPSNLPVVGRVECGDSVKVYISGDVPSSLYMPGRVSHQVVRNGYGNLVLETILTGYVSVPPENFIG